LAFERLRRYLTVENLWMYIISLLMRSESGEMYAYEIKKKLKSDYNISPATVTVYSVLYRMEREGLLKSRSAGSGLGRLAKRYYSPTEKGKQELEKAAHLLEELQSELLFKR